MKVIGLTGGIGCGKTTVAGILEKHFSMKVIYSDEIAKEQMTKDGVSYQAVAEEFGTDILLDDGEIDRRKLGDIVFNDKKKADRLNELTHQPVKEYILEMIEELKKLDTFKAVFVETALLIEAGYSEFCDEVWYVYASEEERKQRLIKYKDMDDAKIEAIFSTQHTDEEYRKYADKVLDNGDEITVGVMFEQISLFLEQ